MDGMDYSNYPIAEPQGLPTRKKVKIPIWSALPGEAQRFAPVMSKIIKFGVHWLKEEKRSYFCGGENGDCMFDHKKQEPKWSCYVLAYLFPYRTETPRGFVSISGIKILHMTPGAILSCPAVVAPDVDLLSCDIKIWREGATKRSEVGMALMDRQKIGIVGRPFDLRAYLIDMFSAPNNEARRAQQREMRS